MYTLSFYIFSKTSLGKKAKGKNEYRTSLRAKKPAYTETATRMQALRLAGTEFRLPIHSYLVAGMMKLKYRLHSLRKLHRWIPVR
ncbi:MAG: hypothetical protein KJ666_08580 [Bacteroidetes bacterium]|nr:hypothetical protein [Bacteroidota bacterium]MBU2584786.1 hypothetical protein [Bacteroidota bacterium]